MKLLAILAALALLYGYAVPTGGGRAAEVEVRAEEAEKVEAETAEVPVGTEPNIAADWGIVLSAEDVTPRGMRLVCTQEGGNADGELHTGSRFAIERFSGGKWEPCADIAEVAWTEEAWNITQDGTVEWDITWDWLYGELPAGRYRIAKEIQNFRAVGDYDSLVCFAEFEILP